MEVTMEVKVNKSGASIYWFNKHLQEFIAFPQTLSEGTFLQVELDAPHGNEGLASVKSVLPFVGGEGLEIAIKVEDFEANPVAA
jgi:hypothetical protein